MKKQHSRHSSTKDRRAAIIRAALACFTEKGYTDTGINDICGRSDSSVGSIYHHFKSKEQLAAAVYLEGIRAYQQGFIGLLNRHSLAGDGVKAMVEYHLKWVEGNRDWARFLLQMRHAGFMSGTEDEINSLNRNFLNSVSAWFNEQADSGALRRMSPGLYLVIVLGPCQEYSREFLGGHQTIPIKTAVKEIGDAVWSALTPTEGTRAVKERTGAQKNADRGGNQK